MTSSELIQEAEKITTTNLENLQNHFSNLSEEQIKWRPLESSWNIQEIFAHLNRYADYYHRIFTSKIKTSRFRSPSENFVSSPLGRSAWKSMKLGNAQNVKRKFKTPKNYNPRLDPKLITGADVQQLEKNFIDLKRIIESAREVNLRKIKIPISISKIIRLRLGDALLFVVYHNERHIQQALNILSNVNFPK